MSKIDLEGMDKGLIRHPLYGNRGHWYAQRIKPGFYTKALEDQAPAVRAELEKAIDAMARKLESGN